MTIDEPAQQATGDEFDRLALRKYRRQMGLSQLELAEIVGYKGAVTISKLETGDRRPSPKQLIKLADALAVSPSVLRGHPASPDTEVDPREGEILLAGQDASARVGGGPSRRIAIIDAMHLAKENQRRRDSLSRAVEGIQEQNRLQMQRLAGAQGSCVDEFLTPFFEVSNRLADFPLPELPDVSGDSTSQTDSALRVRLEGQHASVRRSVAEAIGTTAAGAGTGAAVGAGAAFAAYAGTAALASASTGTAIAGLSGAAATSATLAALGGGSLATGGLGVAGGTMLLSGIVAAPILIAAGVAVSVKGRSMRKQARTESQHLDAAEAALTHTNNLLERIRIWAGKIELMLEEATARGRRDVDWMRSLPPQGGALPWTHQSEPVQNRITVLVSIVATTITLLTLPILAVADDQLDEEEVEAVSRWNDLAIADSEKRLDALLS